MHELFQTMSHDMFHLPLPWLEKVLRPWIIYVVLIAFLRIFGKRELAQLNPFDLVVLLTLSNVVQNAIIGDDNSVSGGIIGAFALLAANWAVSKLLFNRPRVNEFLEGRRTWLIKDGKVLQESLKKEALSHEELIIVLNKNGFTDPGDVEECTLEPTGTFYVKGKKVTSDDQAQSEMLRSLERLTIAVNELHRKLDAQSEG